MSATGIQTWMMGIRHTMATDPVRQEFEDEVQTSGFFWLEEWMDNILNVSHQDSLIELVKTPRRKKSPTKTSRIMHSPSKLRSMDMATNDKENTPASPEVRFMSPKGLTSQRQPFQAISSLNSPTPKDYQPMDISPSRLQHARFQPLEEFATPRPHDIPMFNNDITVLKFTNTTTTTVQKESALAMFNKSHGKKPIQDLGASDELSPTIQSNLLLLQSSSNLPRPPSPHTKELSRKPSIQTFTGFSKLSPLRKSTRDPSMSVAVAPVAPPVLPSRTSWLVKARDARTDDTKRTSIMTTAQTPGLPIRTKFAPKRKSDLISGLSGDEATIDFTSKYKKVLEHSDVTETMQRMPGELPIDEEKDVEMMADIPILQPSKSPPLVQSVASPPPPAPPPKDSVKEIESVPVETVTKPAEPVDILGMIKKKVEAANSKQNSKSVGGAKATAIAEAKAAAEARLLQRQIVPIIEPQEDMSEKVVEPVVPVRDSVQNSPLITIDIQKELDGVTDVEISRPVPSPDVNLLAAGTTFQRADSVESRNSGPASMELTSTFGPAFAIERAQSPAPTTIFHPTPASEASTQPSDFFPEKRLSSVFSTQSSVFSTQGSSIFDLMSQTQSTQDTVFSFASQPSSQAPLLQALMEKSMEDEENEVTARPRSLETNVFSPALVGNNDTIHTRDLQREPFKPKSSQAKGASQPPSSDFDAVDEPATNNSSEDGDGSDQKSLKKIANATQGMFNQATALVRTAFGNKPKQVAPVKSLELAAQVAKKQQEEADKKANRLKEMEGRRQLANQRRQEEDRARTAEAEKKNKEEGEKRRKEREDEIRKARPPLKKNQTSDDDTKKRPISRLGKPNFSASQSSIQTIGPSSALNKSVSCLKPPAYVPPPAYHQVVKTMASTTNLRAAAAATATSPTFAPPPASHHVVKTMASTSSLKAAATLATSTTAVEKAGHAHQPIVPSQLKRQMKVQQTSAVMKTEHIELVDPDSEYSDEDDSASRDAKRAALPDWAQSPEIARQLAIQSSINPDLLFGAIQPIKMDEIFRSDKGDKRSKFRNRTSSANWVSAGDLVTPQEEEQYARRMGFDS